MTAWMVAVAVACWLGILTSISPCPLATNIAAVSFVGRKVGEPRAVLLAGALYAAGRAAAYVLLALVLVAGLLASDTAARFLQQYLNLLVGPLLVVVGLLLLGWIGNGAGLSLAGKGLQERAARGGRWWAALLGFLFALSFCPVSAGLYFGVLLPLAASHRSAVALPAAYGVGTALPVLAMAALLVAGSRWVGAAFAKLTQIERWVRLATGGLLLAAGIYLSLVHVYEIPLLNW